jgi:hypothetical protein
MAEGRDARPVGLGFFWVAWLLRWKWFVPIVITSLSGRCVKDSDLDDEERSWEYCVVYQ